MATGRPIDVEQVRADTPSCRDYVHLNHAGASPSPSPVLDAVIDHLRLEARLGGYEAAAVAAERVERAPAAVAALIGCTPGEVAFATSATQAWDAAFWGLVHAGWFRAGDRILTDRIAYVSTYLAMLQAARQLDLHVEVVASEPSGQLSVADLQQRLDGRVRLVALTHVGTHRGLVNPVVEAGAVLRGSGIPFFLDACQSAGQLPLDVDTIGCDVLAATGRKFLRGPRGTGFLYVRDALAERLDPPGVDARSAEWVDGSRFELRGGARRFEAYETSYAAKVGFGVAVDYAVSLGLDSIAERVGGLAEGLRARLGSIEGVAVHDGGRRRCGIVSFTVAGVEPSEVQAALAAERIHVSTGWPAAARLDMGAQGLDSIVRASPHYLNTLDELEQLGAAVERLATDPAGR
ncbi:MAG: aminotransferase class V-fold PLP-dependent enzyme [Acidimicrobiales bacterium]|nr:aminotransferase class V-fold PLP-dependent enzyme [Acidimicrobiales bacterium]